MNTENTAAKGSNPDLDRLANQSEALDSEIDAENAVNDGTQVAIAEEKPFNEELADVLDLVAMAGSMVLSTVPKHFHHAQNVRIADAMIALADKYGYDLKASFLGENSIVLIWIGFIFAIGAPAHACYADFKTIQAIKAAKEVKNEPEAKPEAKPKAAAKPAKNNQEPEVVTVG